MSVTIAEYMTERTYFWTAWKAALTSKGGIGQYDDDGVVYKIWFYDIPEVHVCTIWKGEVPYSIIDSYSQNQNSTDKSEFETSYKSSFNKRIAPPQDSEGVNRVVEELRGDSRYTIITHNFADKCTWYQESTRVTSETLTTTDPERKIWNSAHTFWIDLSHGRVSDEDDISSSYLPVIKVNDVTKTEATPFGPGTDGDFVIDYEAGTVTFHDSVDTYDPVASYSYAGSSIFTIAATKESGKDRIIRLLEAECQMSADIEMNDMIWYGIYVTIPGVGEVCVKQKKYKTIQDIINEANGAYPVIPAMGGSSRGTPEETITFPWHYVSRTDIRSSLSMKIKVKLPNDAVCGGHAACVAFYCVSLAE